MARQSRRGRRPTRGTGPVKQLPWRSVVNPYKPIEVLSADHIERIQNASLEVLETLGIEFLNAEALDILSQAGADVDFATQMVRFDRGLIAEHVAKAPSTFTLYARDPARNVVIGFRVARSAR